MHVTIWIADTHVCTEDRALDWLEKLSKHNYDYCREDEPATCMIPLHDGTTVSVATVGQIDFAKLGRLPFAVIADGTYTDADMGREEFKRFFEEKIEKARPQTIITCMDAHMAP